MLELPQVDIDTEEDDSYCSEDVQESASTGEDTDSANTIDSIETTDSSNWMYTISKLLIFPFLLTKEAVLKICKAWHVLSEDSITSLCSME